MTNFKTPRHITSAFLRRRFIYDSATGALLRRVQQGRYAPGTRAGTISKRGRWVIDINNEKFYATRLIWLHVKGYWPKKEIDHKNGDSTDDRWENLRLATRVQNNANRIICSSSNKHGYRGVKQQSFRPGRKTFKFYAAIEVKRKNIYLGRFDTAVEAAKAYDAAALKFYGKFAQLNFPVGG